MITRAAPRGGDLDGHVLHPLGRPVGLAVLVVIPDLDRKEVLDLIKFDGRIVAAHDGARVELVDGGLQVPCRAPHGTRRFVVVFPKQSRDAAAIEHFGGFTAPPLGINRDVGDSR